MKRSGWILLLSIFICLGCSPKISENDLGQLNGYWRIDFITHKSESFQPKGMTKLLDHYTLEQRKGIRKKVQPMIDNKFLITDDQNSFSIVYEGMDCFVQFETKWDQWREKIIKLNETELILEHQEKKYHYVRYITD